jgi:hypothetical protein
VKNDRTTGVLVVTGSAGVAADRAVCGDQKLGQGRPLENFDSLYDAATFAVLIAADRIEVVREPVTAAAAEEVRWNRGTTGRQTRLYAGTRPDLEPILN